MFKLNKIFVSFILTLILLSSVVFATDEMTVLSSPEISNIVVEDSATSSTSQVKNINEDLYIYNTDSYTLSDIVYANIFASAKKFVTNPRNNGGIVYGNLFLISNEVVIGSDVTYSESKDKNNNFLINSINSKSKIYGNVYALSDIVTVESGSEIYGDLYIVATQVNIEPNVVIHGNLFVTASEVNLNGQIKLSAYINSKDVNMNLYSYIDKDLFLNSQNATLYGVINRNAFLTIDNALTTMSDFKVNQDLKVIFAKDFTFSGKISGNAKINAKNLSFKNEASNMCSIRGNLDYATATNMEIPNGIVAGEISNSKYIENSSNKISVSSLILKLFTLLIYVFAVVFLSKWVAPKALEKLPKFNVSGILISLGIGLASMFVVLVIFIFLCLSGVGVSLAFCTIAGYLFLFGLAIPLFLNRIAEIIKLNLNLYIKLLIVTFVFYLISLIPVLGSLVVFMSIFIGIGQILVGLFKKNK